MSSFENQRAGRICHPVRPDSQPRLISYTSTLLDGVDTHKEDPSNPATSRKEVVLVDLERNSSFCLCLLILRLNRRCSLLVVLRIRFGAFVSVKSIDLAGL